MAISILKSHIFRKQNSLQLLWPHLPNNAGYSCRRLSRFPFLVLSHHLHFLSHSLPFLHCSHLPPPPFSPLLRLRLHPLFSPMSSLNSSHDTDNPTSPADKTVRMVIKGRVQGVFYRNWTVDNAKELGLKGWVRNRRDGSVEALISGSPDKVQEMEQRCRRGPPDAMVTGLQVFPGTDDPGTTFERFVILKLVSKMLQKILASHKNCTYSPAIDHDFEDDENSLMNGVPEDVKKGHFVVHTVDGGELRRFIVELSYLAHPGFLKLLEQAEQEFGFKQTGILAIPCRYSDLQSVLQSKE